jgi:SPP1 gp7 family putative phage head morphogenesis protein
MGTASTMRADRIARTEVARAQGYGDIQAWTQSGVVTGKEWYTARDENVCPFCNALDGKVFGLTDNMFSKGDVFTVGDQKLDLSCDDVLAAPLHLPVRG